MFFRDIKIMYNLYAPNFTLDYYVIIVYNMKEEGEKSGFRKIGKRNRI